MQGFEQRGGFKDSSRNFKIDEQDSSAVVLDEKGDGNIFTPLFLAGSIPSCTIDLAGSSDHKNQAVSFSSPESAQEALIILNEAKEKSKNKT